ncbi:MAG: glycosyltransferase [Candidatus Rifleibacteriota bacterium]
MTPEVSIIVPAFNEAELIGKTLLSLKSAALQSNTSVELIVVDNDSTDETAAIARKHGAKVVFEPHRQIARARNTGASAAMGRYLIFVDADTTISSELFSKAVNELRRGRTIGGGALVSFDVRPVGLARFLLRVWLLISKCLRLAAGCFIFCEAAAFMEAGGFDNRVYASEELWLSKNLKIIGRKCGKKFVILDGPGVITSARKNSQTLRLLATTLIFSIFPAGVRFRSLCFLWYDCRK